MSLLKNHMYFDFIESHILRPYCDHLPRYSCDHTPELNVRFYEELPILARKYPKWWGRVMDRLIKVFNRGIDESIFPDDETGQWLRNQCEMAGIPLVDPVVAYFGLKNVHEYQNRYEV